MFFMVATIFFGRKLYHLPEKEKTSNKVEVKKIPYNFPSKISFRLEWTIRLSFEIILFSNPSGLFNNER